MGKFRSLPVKESVQQDVQRCGRKPLFAANDVGNVHEPVVHHVGQVVGGHAVALEQDFVVQIQGIDTHPAANAVLKFNLFVARQLDADHVRFTRSQPTLHVFRWEGQAVFHGRPCDAVVLPVGIPCGLGAFAYQLQVFRGVKRVVCVAVGDQLIGVLAVHGFALGLAVRSMGPAHALAFVGRNAAPSQSLQNVLLRTRDKAGLVRVFNAQQEFAAVLLGKQVVV